MTHVNILEMIPIFIIVKKKIYVFLVNNTTINFVKVAQKLNVYNVPVIEFFPTVNVKMKQLQKEMTKKIVIHVIMTLIMMHQLTNVILDTQITLNMIVFMKIFVLSVLIITNFVFYVAVLNVYSVKEIELPHIVSVRKIG